MSVMLQVARVHLRQMMYSVWKGSNRLVLNSHQRGKDQQYSYNKKRMTFQSAANPNKVFDVVGASKDPGAAVCAWDYHGRANQKWKIVPV